MTLVKTTRPLSVAGRQRRAGETVELDEADAERIVWLGWAEKAPEEKEDASGAGKERKARGAKGRA